MHGAFGLYVVVTILLYMYQAHVNVLPQASVISIPLKYLLALKCCESEREAVLFPHVTLKPNSRCRGLRVQHRKCHIVINLQPHSPLKHYFGPLLPIPNPPQHSKSPTSSVVQTKTHIRHHRYQPRCARRGSELAALVANESLRLVPSCPHRCCCRDANIPVWV